jgi:hypothetical protein
MRPIPVAFHIWFLEVHTYGIGLAVTFWFGLRYLERRLRRAGYPWQWVTGMFLWVIVAAIVGARVMHVVANFGYYSNHVGQIIAIWQGGLSSFGGLIAAIPVGVISARRRCPQIPIWRLVDLVAPVLIASWSLGRLLGPQLMRAGGGHPTSQWFGMYYADQVGKRLPVPIFQALEDFAIFCVLLLVERWLRGLATARSAPTALVAAGVAEAGAGEAGTGPTGTTTDAGSTAPGAPAPSDPARDPLAGMPPAGIVLGVALLLWGIERAVDQNLWLSYPGHLGSFLVQLAGVGIAVVGTVVLGLRWRALRAWRERGASGAPDATPAEPHAAVAASAAPPLAAD